MNKTELFNLYERYKDKDDFTIALYIHMPDDSIESIYNSNPHNKMEYVDKTYDENLVHKNSKDIYIVDANFIFKESDDIEYDIGWAINIMKRGKKVARKGWNGKGMFLYYVPPGEYPPSTKIAAKVCINDKGLVPYGAYVAMKTVNGTVVPWFASQTDILARDWYIVK